MTTVEHDYIEYLNTLTPHQLACERAREDLEFFTRCRGFQNKDFHRDWYSHLMDLSIKQGMIIGPRGHAKSQCVNVNHILWQIGRNHNIRIGMISNTATQAENWLREITHIIEHDQVYKEIFGELKPKHPEKWTDSEIVITRDQVLKDPTVTALGVKGPVLSRRFDLVICDDILDDKNTATEHQIKKIEEWVKQTLMGAIEPWGRWWIIGTYWNPLDLYNTIKRDKDEWGTQVFDEYDAIINEKEQEVIWPERWPWEELMNRKRAMGTALFNCMYRCSTEAMKGSILKYEWLRYYDEIPGKLRISMGVDLAVSERQSADHTGIAVIGIDENHNIYVLDTYRAQHIFPEVLGLVKQYAAKWNPERIYIESNETGGISLRQQLQQSTLLPVVSQSVKGDLGQRGRQISVHFENRKVFIRRSMNKFIDEYVYFEPEKPYSEGHYDLLSAFFLAVENAQKGGVSVATGLGSAFRK